MSKNIIRYCKEAKIIKYTIFIRFYTVKYFIGTELF